MNLSVYHVFVYKSISFVLFKLVIVLNFAILSYVLLQLAKLMIGTSTNHKSMHHHFIAGIISIIITSISSLTTNYHKNESSLTCETVMHVYKYQVIETLTV